MVESRNRTRPATSAIARLRGKQIYLELSVALKGTKFKVSLESVRDTLAREGLPAYGVKTLMNWRRVDGWDALVASGATALPTVPIDTQTVSLDDLEAGVARGLDLITKTAQVMAVRLTQLNDDNQATLPEIAECLPILTRCINETLALRRQITDDRAREAIDVPARPLALAPPSPLSSTLEKLRAKLDADATEH